MEVVLDTPAIPLTEDEIKTFLLPREPRTDIEIAKVELTQEMIAAAPQLPDPVFQPGEVVPCAYTAGAPLDQLERHAAEFGELIKEMFEKGVEIKLTEEGVQEAIDTFMEITMPTVENE